MSRIGRGGRPTRPRSKAASPRQHRARLTDSWEEQLDSALDGTDQYGFLDRPQWPIVTPAETGADEDEDLLDDAFALLGNETRMGILRALWEERDPFVPTDDYALSFTELRKRIGATDPGRFNYHLNELVDDFVRRTDSGYVLRPNTILVLRAADIRSDIGDTSLGPTPADDPCPFCGAAVEVLYADEQLVVRCTECPGEYEREGAPSGTLIRSQRFPPTGIEGRSGQEIWEALINHSAAAVGAFLRGVCYECAASTTTSVSVCSDHETDGICEQCGSTQAAMGTIQCETCGAAWRGEAWLPALTHPEVIGFFHDHGFDAHGGLTLDMFRELLTSPETVRSTEPLRLEKSVELDGDGLTVIVDDALAVVDVNG